MMGHTFELNVVFQYALLLIILGLIGWQTLSLGLLKHFIRLHILMYVVGVSEGVQTQLCQLLL